MTRKRTKLSKTYYRRATLRLAQQKATLENGRGFANTEGRSGFEGRPSGVYYEAAPLPTELGAACELYICNRVFRREREAGLIIGGWALDAAATAVWLGTNTRP